MINRESVQGRRREAPVGVNADNYTPLCDGVLEKPGDFLWLTDAGGSITHLLLFIPGNEGGSIAPIPVARPGQPADNRWMWNEDLDRPTLSPSIYRNKPSEGRPIPRNEWHGNLINGFLHSD